MNSPEIFGPDPQDKFNTTNFDSGFALRFPKENALVEGLLQNGRTIAERITPENARFYLSYEQTKDEYLDVIFPITHGETFLYHNLPKDARELRSYIHMLNSPENAESLGRLFGSKILMVNKIFGGIPSSNIIDRFSVFTPVGKHSKRQSSGIDMRLLPPFDDLTGSLEEISWDITPDRHGYSITLVNSMVAEINHVS